VQLPSQVAIVRIEVSQNRVTTQQTAQWSARMIVQNNGDAPVLYDPAQTRLIFDIFGQGDKAGEYSYVRSGTFTGTGGDTLYGQSVDSVLFTINFTGFTPGNLTLGGEFCGTDLNGQNTVCDNTGDGGSANLVVELPGFLNIFAIQTSQPAVTASQDSSWTVNMIVENPGGSEIALETHRDSTGIMFDLGAGWAFNDPVFENGPNLAGNSTKTVSFLVTKSGDTQGTARIDGFIRGVQTNDGVPKSDNTNFAGFGSIDIETAAGLIVDAVRPLQDPVTAGQTNSWSVEVDVRNPGPGGAIALIDRTGGLTALDFPDATSAFTVQAPTGPDSVASGATATLTFVVTQTPTFAAAGRQTIDATIAGTDANTRAPLQAGGSDGVTVEDLPTPTYVLSSLQPPAVSIGSNVNFSIGVTSAPGMATVVLDPTSTTFTLSDGQGHQATAELNGVIDNAIEPGVMSTLVFKSLYVNPDFLEATVAPQIKLVGTQNGIPFSDLTFSTSPDNITLQQPSQVTISKITVSQSRVTSGQTRNWTATMSVQNTPGGAPVMLDPVQTNLIFDIFGQGDRSLEYQVNKPLAFFASGDDTLRSGATDSLRFTITTTGTTKGQLILGGVFTGTDLNSQAQVQDNTADGGSANLLVENPGDLKIVSVTPSQPRVTVGQTTDWQAVVVVQNTGEAAVQLTFTPSTTPEVRPSNPAGYIWGEPTALAGGGDDVLAGGEIDSLIFVVDQTGTTDTPVEVLHGKIDGIEINSGDALTFDTQAQGSGSGNVEVQTRAALRFQSTVIDAPNTPEVNANQTFGVVVQLVNTGGADVQNAQYLIGVDDDSDPQLPAIHVAASIPGGGGTVVDTFLVDAGTNLGSETATVSWVEAFDANAASDLNFVTLTNGPDATATFTKVTPAVLVIDSVVTSQGTVTRQQTQPWNVDVHLNNTGGATFDVTPPQPSDIGFYFGGAHQNDYIVSEPTSFVSGTVGDWMVAPGANPVLRYTVTTTGAAIGVVKAQANVAATDVNDLGALADEDSTTISVVSPSGLFISMTRVDTLTAPNNPQSNVALVNSQQAFKMEVVVSNTGEEVDSVQVNLTSDGSPGITPVDPGGAVRIQAGNDFTFVFDVVADNLLPADDSKLVIFSSSITRAISVNSQTPITPGTAADDQELVTVQKPVDLQLNLTITAPPAATDGSVSTDQVFEVTGIVTNAGIAAIDATTAAEVTLSLPGGFSRDSGAAMQEAFTIDNPIVWNIQAPSTAVAGQSISANISTMPLQLNVAQPAAASQPNDAVAVDVLDSGGFGAIAMNVITPAGAADNTVSADQVFTVRADVTPGVTTVSNSATIVLGSGLTSIDPVTQALADGDGNPQSVQYRITAPSNASLDDVMVRFNGQDVNTSAAVLDSTPVITITVVPKAVLTLSAIIASPEAQDNQVSVGAPFEIKAVVENGAGFADIDTTVAKPRIRMVLPATGNYTFDPTSDPEIQAFSLGDSVSWIIRAPLTAAAAELLTARIENVPNDENTNAAAQVAVSQQAIPMQTGTSNVTVDNVSSALGIGTNVVPMGTADVTMMAVEIANPSATADPARVDYIDIELRTAQGGLASNPAATITELYAIKGGQRVSANVGQNPMRLPVAAVLGANAVIQPTAADTFTIFLSVSASAALEELSIGIADETALSVVNTVSAAPFTIEGKNGQNVAGAFDSPSLVILSNSFEEYVHNYPNPFGAGREMTRIAYFLQAASEVSVTIYTITGEKVFEKQLAIGDAGTGSGPQEFEWDGRNMSSEIVRNGLYICRLEAGGNTATFRIAVAK
jgi:hypothetical protein